MYAKGQGVRQNDTEAVKWFRIAAEQGHARAQRSLGLMHAKGWGVTKNDAEAVKWFRAAAEQGDAKAQFNLGLVYAKANGVTQNRQQKWFRAQTPDTSIAG
ncbi:MAG: tetratricopeptide repeat protein [Rhodospirillales bacterium]